MTELVLSPLTWLIAAMLVGCLSMRWRRGRAVRVACVAVAALSVAAMTPLAANGLLGLLEDAEASPPACVRMPPAVAVVLAGGLAGRASGPDDVAALGLASRRRLDHAVAWWREGAGRRLVMSGGSWFGDGITDAGLMLRYARRLGVPADGVAVEDRSLTTWESARALAAMQPRLPGRVALVTSAAHMPRAAYAMREAGFEVCPVATDARAIPPDFPGLLIPQRSALGKTEGALHEIVGMAWYRWLAWRQRADPGQLR